MNNDKLGGSLVMKLFLQLGDISVINNKKKTCCD